MSEIKNQTPPVSQGSSWVAVDGLGRTLPTNREVGNLRKDKFVGIFYWTWHGDFAKREYAYNIQKLLDTHPDLDKNDINSPLWGDFHEYHFWNEPVFGYYDGEDPWVIRKHAEMLADAGVDVVFFDNTNGPLTWLPTALRLMEVYDLARKDGVRTPQIGFMLPFSASPDAAEQLRELYGAIYKKNFHPDLWFRWDGKPLILAHKECLDLTKPEEKEIYDFFAFRENRPGYLQEQTREDQWGWLSTYPQAIFKNREGKNEQVTVGVAVNYDTKTNFISPMNGENISGRTYTSKGYDTRENAVCYGAHFEEQWEYALKADPEFIFVTGWNEWVAMRGRMWPPEDTGHGVRNAFPDQFCDAFSRDVEPSTGALKDHYYYQLVSFIRKFKGALPAPEASGKITIDIAGNPAQWDNVQPEFSAYRGNTRHRDYDGYRDPETKEHIHYVNNTGRNDICGAKVARDNDNLYFLVKTADPLTNPKDPAWMRLFLEIGGRENAPAWETFQYVVNRQTPGDTTALLEKSEGGWNWTAVGEVDYTVQGNLLQIKIPKKLLDIEGDNFTVNFKWADNTQKDGDIMDFYVSGDVAPLGRFKYQYNAKA